MTQPWPIFTTSGAEIWYANPWRTRVCSRDLRAALGNIRRYGGSYDWTVLQHLGLCVEIATALRLPQQLIALCAIHDAHEAYIGDLDPCLKGYLGERWTDLEAAWEERVHHAFGFELPTEEEKAEVKRVDLLALAAELAVLEERPRALALLAEQGVEPVDRHVRIMRARRHDSRYIVWRQIEQAVRGAGGNTPEEGA